MKRAVYQTRGLFGFIRFVAIPVTWRDIQRGINAEGPGLYLFRGAWYGSDLTSHESYGKIEGRVGHNPLIRPTGQYVTATSRLKL